MIRTIHIVCSPCRGSGKIVSPVDGDLDRLRETVCPSCLGTGKRPSIVRDPFSGKVPGR